MARQEALWTRQRVAPEHSVLLHVEWMERQVEVVRQRLLGRAAVAEEEVLEEAERPAEAKAPPHLRQEPVEVGGGAPTQRPSWRAGARRTAHELCPSVP